MDRLQAAEAAREMGRVRDALIEARRVVAGIEQVQQAFDRRDEDRYSPLRTLVEQAIESAERVHEALRDAAARPPRKGPSS